MHVQIDTLDRSFQTLPSVSTGTTLASFTASAQNDDIGNGLLTSSVTFTAIAGTEYQIAVDGYSGVVGALSLILQLTAPPPPNDNFANRTLLTGLSSTTSAANAFAT